MSRDESRVVELVVIAAQRQRTHGKSDVVFVSSEDALLLQTVPGVRSSGSWEAGGNTHCTNFYFHDYHFRHVFSVQAVAEMFPPSGQPC